MVIPTPECSEIQTERADPVPRLANGGLPGEEAATSTVSNQYHKVGHKEGMWHHFAINNFLDVRDRVQTAEAIHSRSTFLLEP